MLFVCVYPVHLQSLVCVTHSELESTSDAIESIPESLDTRMQYNAAQTLCPFCSRHTLECTCVYMYITIQYAVVVMYHEIYLFSVLFSLSVHVIGPVY